MKDKQARYKVQTQDGAYDVDSVYDFIHIIRPQNMDFSAIQSVQMQKDDQWVQIDSMDWVNNHY